MSLKEVLALDGIVQALKISNWRPMTIINGIAKNPTDITTKMNSIGLATAVWLQVVTSTLNPILMFFQYKKDKSMAPKERNMLITQEAAKQFVHLCLHVGVMLIGVKAAKNAISKKALNEAVNALKLKNAEGFDRAFNILDKAKVIKFLEKNGKHGEIAQALKGRDVHIALKDLNKHDPHKLLKPEALETLHKESLDSVLKNEDTLKNFQTLIKKEPGLLDEGAIGPYKTAISNIAGCVAGAVMLPILGATLFKAMDKKMGLTESHGGGAPAVATAAQEEPKGLNQVSEAPQMVQMHPIESHVPMVHPNHPVHLTGNWEGVPVQGPQASPTPQPVFGKKPANPYATSPFATPMARLAR